MKKVFVILFLFTSLIYGTEQGGYDFGLSLGNISFSAYEDRAIMDIDLFSVRFINRFSGLGLTCYIWPVLTNYNMNNAYEEYKSYDFGSLELNWEPFYSSKSTFGRGIYFRVNNLLPNETEINWDTGIRLDYRSTKYGFIYPLGSIEAGFNSFGNLYLSIGLDPVVFFAIVYN